MKNEERQEYIGYNMEYNMGTIWVQYGYNMGTISEIWVLSTRIFENDYN